jgi:hypothetical protein
LLGWTGWFWLYVLVLVPLIIWYERKYRRDHMLEAVLSVDPNQSPWANSASSQMGLLAAGVTSVLFWGPRGLVDGLRGMIGRRTVVQSAVIDRAVLLVPDLNAYPGRVEVKKLIHPPEEMQIFAQSVDMLDALDLIGKSKEGDSLWLSSTFRQKLVDFNRATPTA